MTPFEASQNDIEVWADVPHYVGRYRVSNLGRVLSVSRVIDGPNGQRRRISEKILKASPDAYGYPRVTLSINNVSEYKKVFELVMTTFVGELKHGQECRHLKDNKLDSRLHMLAYGTRLDNVDDRFDNGLATRTPRSRSSSVTGYNLRKAR